MQYLTYKVLLNKKNLTERNCQLWKMKTQYYQTTYNQERWRNIITRIKDKSRKCKDNYEEW